MGKEGGGCNINAFNKETVPQGATIDRLRPQLKYNQSTASAGNHTCPNTRSAHPAYNLPDAQARHHTSPLRSSKPRQGPSTPPISRSLHTHSQVQGERQAQKVLCADLLQDGRWISKCSWIGYAALNHKRGKGPAPKWNVLQENKVQVQQELEFGGEKLKIIWLKLYCIAKTKTAKQYGPRNELNIISWAPPNSVIILQTLNTYQNPWTEPEERQIKNVAQIQWERSLAATIRDTPGSHKKRSFIYK